MEGFCRRVGQENYQQKERIVSGKMAFLQEKSKGFDHVDCLEEWRGSMWQTLWHDRKILD